MITITSTNYFDILLHNHVLFEFGGLGKLFETHGYYDKITDITDVISHEILHDLLDSNEDPYELRKTYDDMSMFKDINPFFTELKLRVDLKYSSAIKRNKIDASYDPINSKIQINDGVVSFCPMITISGFCNSKSGVIDEMIYTLGHEFTHAYNDYMVYVKSGHRKRLKDLSDMSKINNAISNPNSLIGYMIGAVLYMADQAEKNAFIAQLKNELELYKGDLNSSKDCTHAIMTTNTYQNIQNVTAFCNKFEEEINQNEKGTDNAKILFVDELNRIAEKNFKNFESAFKWFKYQVYEINANFNKKAPKIVHDVYTQRNDSKRINVDFDTLDKTSKRINRIFYEK